MSQISRKRGIQTSRPICILANCLDTKGSVLNQSKLEYQIRILFFGAIGIVNTAQAVRRLLDISWAQAKHFSLQGSVRLLLVGKVTQRNSRSTIHFRTCGLQWMGARYTHDTVWNFLQNFNFWVVVYLYYSFGRWSRH